MLNTTNPQGMDFQEGIQYETDGIALDLSDDDVARAIGNRVSFARSWWNTEEKLEEVQKKAEQVWLNMVSNDVDLYDYQEAYTENRIFVAIESLLPQALGKAPHPIVTQAYDTDASKELARNYEKVLLARYRDLHLKSKLEMVGRHLLTGFRYGVMKYRWDNSIGRKRRDGKRSGGIAIDVVRPDKIIFDAGATDKYDIPLIAEQMQASHEDLIFRYPAKEHEIMSYLGKSYGTQMPLTDLTNYLETHYTGYKPDTGEEYEGIAWKLDYIVLDKMRNPNFNYDEMKTNEKGETEYLNFFDKPRKPYVVFNYLNQGKYIVDSTSLTEQAKQLQRQLERRGRQIDENADMANAGTIYNSLMVDESLVGKLVGDPGEKVMAKGDVNKAAMRLPVNTLEEYVVQDKVDLRGAIDTIFGANAPLLGEKSGNETLGQDELSTQRNTSRLGTFATAMEEGVTEVYRAIAQLDKVFMTEADMVRYVGPEGHTEFINFSNMNIESGISIIVREGSILPEDPTSKLQEAEQFATVLDELTLAEYMGVPDPKKTAKQMFLRHTNPSQYGEEILGIPTQGNHDPEAVNAIQQISQGQTPPVPESPSNNYVNQLQAHISSPAYGQMSPIAQAQLRHHAKQTIENARKGLGIQQPKSDKKPQEKKKGILGKFGDSVKKTLFA